MKHLKESYDENFEPDEIYKRCFIICRKQVGCQNCNNFNNILFFEKNNNKGKHFILT